MEKIKEYLKGKLPNSQFTVHDDYTVLQLLWRLIVPSINCIIDDMADLFSKYYKILGTDLPNNIKLIINEMKENGQLSDIINQEVYDKVLFYPIRENELQIDNILEQYEYGDIRRYGAIADGVTDCTLAIQTAINLNSEVIIPCSDNYWLITKTLEVKPNTNINGFGMNSVIHTLKDIVMLAYKGTSNRCDGLSINNMVFYKHFDNSTVESINFTKISHSFMSNVYIRKTGTSGTNCIGLKCGNNVGEAYTYYNLFNKIKIDGFDTGISLNSASNGNTFQACAIINGRLGCIVDKCNSNTLYSVGFEMLSEMGLIVQNKSVYNSFYGLRFESVPNSYNIKWGANGTSSFGNYIFGALDYSENGHMSETSNVEIISTSYVPSIPEWNDLTVKSCFIGRKGGTTVTIQGESVIPLTNTIKDTKTEYDLATQTFTAKEPGNYLVSAEIDTNGSQRDMELNVFVANTKYRTLDKKSGTVITLNGSCIVSLAKGETIQVKALTSLACNMIYSWTNNRVEIARL